MKKANSQGVARGDPDRGDGGFLLGRVCAVHMRVCPGSAGGPQLNHGTPALAAGDGAHGQAGGAERRDALLGGTCLPSVELIQPNLGLLW